MWDTLWNWIYEAVFQIGEAGFKLFVTTWVPRFMQSVYVLADTKHITVIGYICGGMID